MSQAISFNPVPILATELQLPPGGIEAVIKLMGEGGTVPFIARYRKEATGGLDEVQIRAIQERRDYLLEMAERRQVILDSIHEQGKLTDELRAKIVACTTKAELEDLYLPYKPKRRTRATIARERGLEPLAQLFLAQAKAGDPRRDAEGFVNVDQGVTDIEAAMAGARDIIAEIIAETASLRQVIRAYLAQEGKLVAEVHPDQAGERTKFEQYYNYSEPVAQIPSHRFLALRRGEKEKVLRVRLEADAEHPLSQIERQLGLDARSPYAEQLKLAASDALGRLLSPSLENDIRAELKLRSDQAAIEIFASNLRNLLLASPLGARAVVGIDPGLRTGCKCVALDSTGKYLEHLTIYISQGEKSLQQARQATEDFLKKHHPFAVAMGNGTGSRETEAFLRQLLSERGLTEIVPVVVNESGASVYSASEIARQEFPQLDVTIRGAISIARRLQDPLAELVKIEPKAIGVGQYQHDVNQTLLQRKLDEVVESCVNQVGVELNTASSSLLAQVAGVGPSLAKKIVAHREKNGAFADRQKLLDVSGLGPRAFEQAAGFLRIRGGRHPLDNSAVHPERYELVARMASDLQVELDQLVGSSELVARIEIARYLNGEVGEPTLLDIMEELRKPGRDPRTSFELPKFIEGVNTLEDLRSGMELEGVVTNVTAFGAFVDLGVHQDGLVHISQLADRYIKDPREVVHVGDKLHVRVLEVDLERRRISLTARKDSSARPTPEQRAPRAGRSSPSAGVGQGHPGRAKPSRQTERPRAFSNTPFANLLAKPKDQRKKN